MDSQVVAQMLDSLMRVLVMEAIRALVWNVAALVPISYGVWLQKRLKRK